VSQGGRRGWLLFIRAPSVGAAGDSAAPTVEQQGRLVATAPTNEHCRGGW